MPTNNHIEVIARTIDVLEAFEGKPGMSLNELSHRVPIVKSSIYRILYTLEELGYVSKSSGGKYSLTGKFGRLVVNPQSNTPTELPAIALPFMASLLRRYQETVNLGVLHGDEVLYIRVLESPHAFRLAAHAGMRSPLHSTALGKALLSQMAPLEIEKFTNAKLLRRCTNRTICDRSRFMRELATVHRRGYAVDSGEDSDGAKCFGAAIISLEGKPIASMSISGPATRMDKIPEPEIGGRLLQTCRKISAVLGYAAPKAPLATVGD